MVFDFKITSGIFSILTEWEPKRKTDYLVEMLNKIRKSL
jgi:hypothetical protein